jgi:hypothetical protein
VVLSSQRPVEPQGGGERGEDLRRAVEGGARLRLLAVAAQHAAQEQEGAPQLERLPERLVHRHGRSQVGDGGLTFAGRRLHQPETTDRRGRRPAVAGARRQLLEPAGGDACLIRAPCHHQRLDHVRQMAQVSGLAEPRGLAASVEKPEALGRRLVLSQREFEEPEDTFTPQREDLHPLHPGRGDPELRVAAGGVDLPQARLGECAQPQCRGGLRLVTEALAVSDEGVHLRERLAPVAGAHGHPC